MCDCKKECLTPAEVAHHTRAAAAAAWLAAREAAVNAVKCGCRVISDWNPDGECACPANCAEDDVIALRALPPPADAAAALAEVVRKAKREAFEEAAKIADDEFDRATSGKNVAANVAMAIRARGEGGE